MAHHPKRLGPLPREGGDGVSRPRLPSDAPVAQTDRAPESYLGVAGSNPRRGFSLVNGIIIAPDQGERKSFLIRIKDLRRP